MSYRRPRPAVFLLGRGGQAARTGPLVAGVIEGEDAIAAAKHAQEKLKAASVKPGKYDLVLDPSHTWLTIHE